MNRATGSDASVRSLLLDTQAVIDAARRVRKALDADVEALERAVDRLERAATRSDEHAAGYRSFMFDEAPRRRAAAGEPAAPDADDALALAATDLGMAGMLAAAAEAASPSGDPQAVHAFDDAVRSLDRQRESLERAAAGARGRRMFAFDAEAPAPAASADVGAATRAFQARADRVLATLVEEVDAIAVSVYDKLPLDRARDALELVGRTSNLVKNVGRILRLALRKLESALKTIVGLVGPDAVEKVKGWLRGVVEKAARDARRETLKRLLAVDDTRRHVANVLARDGLSVAGLDGARGELERLQGGFEAKMRLVAAGVTGAGLVASIGTVTGRAEVALAAGAALLLLLGVAVLLARDHGDAGGVVELVRGVRQIADGVVPVRA